MSNIIGFKPRKVEVSEEDQLIRVRALYDFLIMFDHDQMFSEINKHYIPDEDNPYNAWFNTFTSYTYDQFASSIDPNWILSHKDDPDVKFEAWLRDFYNISDYFFDWVNKSEMGSTNAITLILAGTTEVMQTIFIKTVNGIYLRDIYLDKHGTIATASMHHYCAAFNCSIAQVYTDKVDASMTQD